jgi:hypothetical protein
MGRLAIVAGGVAAELAALDGPLGGGGEARTFAPGAGLGGYAPDAVVALGAEPPGDVEVPVARWAWSENLASGAGAPGRVVAAVEGAWRRAIPPAADPLFDLRAEPGAAVLVVGGEEAHRDRIAAKLGARGAPARPLPVLGLADLRAAAVVVAVGGAGEIGGGETVAAPPPDYTAAVLAAGRILVIPRPAPAFGLVAGVDHLPYAIDEEAAELADAVASHPHAFEGVRAMGVLAARAHRASAVYGRLLEELMDGS